MAVNTLCSAFRRLALKNQCTIITRLASTDAAGLPARQRNVPNNTLCSSKYPELSIKFIPGSLSINFGVAPYTDVNKSITEAPLKYVPSMEEPMRQNPSHQDIPFSDKSFELPSLDNTFEKHAVSMLRIRKKKMQKHKRRKLRKKMKFVWEKIRIKRNLLKEKLFKQELMEKVKKAHAFNPEEYVQSRIDILTKERLPYTWRGEIIPQTQIEEFVKEKERRKEAKRNPPRLKL